MKRNSYGNYSKLLGGAALILALGVTNCNPFEKEKESNSQTLTMFALLAATSTQNPGTCSFTFGSSNVMIQEYSVAANGSSSFPSGFSTNFKNWAAVKLPSVANGTTVAFNYAPFYFTSSKGNIYLVYEASGCPLNNSSTADMNYTFPDLATSRTPTNYTVSGNTFTFGAAAAGKNIIIVSGASSRTGSETVTRTN